jgi:hypothetical protein
MQPAGGPAAMVNLNADGGVALAKPAASLVHDDEVTE